MEEEPRLAANTDLAARWLLERFPGAGIVCVEPQVGNAALLRANLAAQFGCGTAVFRPRPR